jgi:hypothetical protein
MIEKILAILSHPVMEMALICLIVAFIVVSTIENILVIDMEDDWDGDVDMTPNIEGWDGSSKKYTRNLYMKKHGRYIGNRNNMDRVNRAGYDASGDPADDVGEYSVYARKSGERYNRYHSADEIGNDPRVYTTVGHKMSWTSSTRKPWWFWWMKRRGMAYYRRRYVRVKKWGPYRKNIKVCRWVNEGFVGGADGGNIEGFVEGATGSRKHNRWKKSSNAKRMSNRRVNHKVNRRVNRKVNRNSIRSSNRSSKRVRKCEVKRVRRWGWHFTYVPKYIYYWKQHRRDYTNASHTIDESNFNTLSSTEAKELKTKLRGVSSQLSTSGSVVNTNTTRIKSIAPTVNKIKKDVDMISGLPKMVKKGLSENGVWS